MGEMNLLSNSLLLLMSQHFQMKPIQFHSVFHYIGFASLAMQPPFLQALDFWLVRPGKLLLQLLLLQLIRWSHWPQPLVQLSQMH